MVELFANGGDPDQTPHSAASDLGLYCLPVTHLGVSNLRWDNCWTSDNQCRLLSDAAFCGVWYVSTLTAKAYLLECYGKYGTRSMSLLTSEIHYALLSTPMGIDNLRVCSYSRSTLLKVMDCSNAIFHELLNDIVTKYYLSWKFLPTR